MQEFLSSFTDPFCFSDVLYSFFPLWFISSQNGTTGLCDSQTGNRTSHTVTSYYKKWGRSDINLFNPFLQWCGIRGSVSCLSTLLNSWSGDLLQILWKILPCRREMNVLHHNSSNAFYFALCVSNCKILWHFPFHLSLGFRRQEISWSTFHCMVDNINSALDTLAGKEKERRNQIGYK